MTRALRFILLVSLVGCGSPPPASVDAATPPADANDLDANDVDASDGLCGMPTGSGFPQLPAGCLPRCGRAARDVYQRCGVDLTCFFADAAVTGDDTPHAFLGSGAGPIEISCARSSTTSACVDWQANSCVFASCPNEYDRAADCTSDCAAAQQALMTCFNASQASYQPCFNLRVPGCFPLD